jgi:hypothetical protein
MRSREFRLVPKILETPKKKDLQDDVVNLGTLKSLLSRKKAGGPHHP